MREAGIASNINLTTSGVPFISYSGWVPETKKYISTFQIPQSATLTQLSLAQGTASAPTTLGSMSIVSNTKINGITMSGGTIDKITMTSGTISAFDQRTGASIIFVKPASTPSSAGSVKFNPGYYNSIRVYDPANPDNTTAYTCVATNIGIGTKRGYITNGFVMPTISSATSVSGAGTIYMRDDSNSGTLYATPWFFSNSSQNSPVEAVLTSSMVNKGTLTSNSPSAFIVVRSTSSSTRTLRVSFTNSTSGGVTVGVPPYGFAMVRAYYDSSLGYSAFSVSICRSAPIWAVA